MYRILLRSLLFFAFLFVERQLSTFIDIPYNFLFRAVTVYLFILFYCFKKKPTGSELLLTYLLGFIIPDIVIRFLEDFVDASRTWPDVMLEILPAISAYCVYKSRQYIPTIITAIFLAVFIMFLSPYFIQYANFGNWTGRVRQPVSGFISYNENKDTIRVVDYKDKIVVFDIWNTNCPSCFACFPILQGLYNKYKSDSTISIQALNIPLARDTGNMAFTVIKKKNFSFPVVVSANHSDSVFKIDAFPLVLVLYKQEVVFRGNIEDVEKVIQDLKHGK